MARLVQRLLRTLAFATDHDLRRQIPFLKAENELLRSRLDKQGRLQCINLLIACNSGK